MPASSDSSAAAGGSGGQAPVRKKALWRKITCCVAPILCTGLLVMMAILVFLTLYRAPDYEVPNNAPYLKLVSVPDWLENSKEAMIDLENDNLARLTSERVQYVGEIYGRVQEDVLTLQAIAGQVLLQTPRDLIVERYVKRNPGLEQTELRWNHSIWYIPDFGVGEAPTWNSSLQDLLKRSSLLEPTFRSMNKQHKSAYVAGLESPGAGIGLVSQINMQTYPAFKMVDAGYLDFSAANGCDDRFTQYGDSYAPSGYEPRCQVWYQDAVEGENEDAVFTKPYSVDGSGTQVVTAAAPVFRSGDSELLGVAAIDIEYTDIEQAVEAYKIVENEGYTYLLASGSSGEVLAHVNHSSWTTEYIADIEAGVDRAVFGALVTRMSTESSGNESYSKAGKTWLLSWKHMKTRIPSVTGEQSPDDSSEGVIAVSTVSETAFLLYFNEMEKDIRNHVIVAIIIISVLIVTVGVLIGCLAWSLASRMTQPLAKLVDVVKALKRKDPTLTNQGLWLMEGLPSPEFEDLVRSFENMTTVVQFSSTSLRNGDLEAAQKKYMDALVLFEKLGNYRGVSIVYNNLGNIYTAQAKDLVQKAAASKNKVQAGKLLEQADANFKEAITSFTIAIEDAEALYPRNKRRDGRGYSRAPPAKGGKGEEHKKDKEEWEEEAQPAPAPKKRASFNRLGVFSSRKSDANADSNSQEKEPAMDNKETWAIIKGALNMNAANSKKEGIITKAEANRISPKGKRKSLPRVADDVSDADDNIEAPKLDRRPLSQRLSGWFRWGGPHPENEDDYNSSLTLALQLFNRKFNLALCLAAKGTSAVSTGGMADAEVIDEARKLLWDCAELAAGTRDAKGDQRHVECLLELATLECDVPGREKEAGEALDAAERVIIAHRGARRRSLGKIYTRKGDIREESLEGTGISAPLSVLRQQLLTARGAHCLTVGDPDAAITQWTDAILDCGDRMDVNAVLSSLQGLRELAVKGLGGRFPPHFLSAVGIPKGTSVRASKNQKLIIALDVALAKVDSKTAKYTRISEGILGAKTTDVDLCFIMDCTQSMQTWIDQFNKKILPTIEQAKSEVLNINFRIGFVGYRDFGDKVQYEGPFDFHSEEDLPKLVKTLEGIKADGGKDIPDDLAGGLNQTLNLSWKSPIRIMMVITDAPCHGSIYHDFYDNYPKGCPKKLDPSKLIYTLQYQLGVDIYFVRISTQTDKMIGIFENNLSMFTENRKNRALPALRGSDNTEPKFLVHDLGVNKLRFSEAVVQSIRVSAGISEGVGNF